jgi:hypothetical protein
MPEEKQRPRLQRLRHRQPEGRGNRGGGEADSQHLHGIGRPDQSENPEKPRWNAPVPARSSASSIEMRPMLTPLKHMKDPRKARLLASSIEQLAICASRSCP